MTRTLRIAIVGLAASAPFMAGRSSPGDEPESAAASPGEVERALLRLDRERDEAIVGRDVDALDRIWAAEYLNTTASGAVRDKAQSLAFHRSGRLKHESIKSDDLKVRVFGDSAVLTGLADSIQESEERGRLATRDRFTRVYLKKDGRWQLVAQHISRLESQEVE